MKQVFQRYRSKTPKVDDVPAPREPYYKKELELQLSMSDGPGRYDNLYEEQRDYPFAYVRWTEQRNMQAP